MFKVIIKLLYGILLLVETLVSIRFIFFFIGANENNTFVSWIIDATEVLVDPFKGALGKSFIDLAMFRIELDSVVALIIYMLCAFFLIELLRAFSYREKVE